MSTRDDILKGAGDAINGPRRESYGDAQESFQRIADLWTAYTGTAFTPAQVAIMLALLKVGRLAQSPEHFDSWLDLAGYAALGGEVAGSVPPRDERGLLPSGLKVGDSVPCGYRPAPLGLACIRLVKVTNLIGDGYQVAPHEGEHAYPRVTP